MQRIRLIELALMAGGLLLAGILNGRPARAQSGRIGINVLVNTVLSDAVLADLGQHGQVLDVIPEIKAVTLKADAVELPAIQALPCAAGATPDRERFPAQAGSELPVSDFANGANQWTLDAVNVTDAGGGRTVAQDGAGVYVAVID